MRYNTFIYSLKVWATTIGFAFIGLAATITYFSLNKPPEKHHIDDPGPFLGTILFFIFNIIFLPAMALFFFLVLLIEKKIKPERRRITINLIALLLIAATFSPLIITDVSDKTYYPIAGDYLVSISVSVWLFKLNPKCEELSIVAPTE